MRKIGLIMIMVIGVGMKAVYGEQDFPHFQQDKPVALSVSAVVYGDTALYMDRLRQKFPNQNIFVRLFSIQDTTRVDEWAKLVGHAQTLPVVYSDMYDAQIAFQAGHAKAKGQDLIADLFRHPKGLYILPYTPETDIDEGQFKIFLMSRCPYGQRAVMVLDEFSKVYPDRATTLDIGFIMEQNLIGRFVSLHGEEEVKENYFWKFLLTRDVIRLNKLVRYHVTYGNTEPFSKLMNGFMKADFDSLNRVFETTNVRETVTQVLLDDYQFSQRFHISASPTFVVGGKWIASFEELENFDRYKGISAFWTGGKPNACK